MKIQLMSDLHMEMHKDTGVKFAQDLTPEDVDVLVLAGDISYHSLIRPIFEIVCAKYPQVVYVPGNHEFYCSSVKDTYFHLQGIERTLGNLHILWNQVKTIEGKRFVGGTMWFKETTGTMTQKYWLNDYRMIKDFEPWVYVQNSHFRNMCLTKMEAGDIVVTHYLPSNQSVASYYKGSSLNCYFVSDMDDVILDKKPALWLHGHTHTPCDYMLGETRVVANPLGYPKEKSAHTFNEKLIIEI